MINDKIRKWEIYSRMNSGVRGTVFLWMVYCVLKGWSEKFTFYIFY